MVKAVKAVKALQKPGGTQNTNVRNGNNIQYNYTNRIIIPQILTIS